MTTQIKDLPENESDTPGARLKTAREDKGLTRKKVAEMTGIPVKSLEKIEYGGMEPNISRLKAICTALDIEPSFILSAGEDETTDVVDNSPVKASDENIENIRGHDSMANEYLQMLDTLRQTGFENSTRKTEAYFNELKSTLCFLEYGELLELAKVRGIKVEDNISEETDPRETEEFTGIYEDISVSEKPDCEELANRIIDTAVFGVDFYSIELDELSTMAEEHDLSPDRFIWAGWRGHSEIVPKIREEFLEETLLGKVEEDFQSYKRSGAGKE